MNRSKPVFTISRFSVPNIYFGVVQAPNEFKICGIKVQRNTLLGQSVVVAHLANQ